MGLREILRGAMPAGGPLGLMPSGRRGDGERTECAARCGDSESAGPLYGATAAGRPVSVVGNLHCR